MKKVAGIDGGGTGTTLELRDMSGNILEREKFGPFNINSIGRERFGALLKEIFTAISEAGECAAVCVGAAGISNPIVSDIITEEAKLTLPDCKLLLRGDHDIALYGAAEGGPGAILIAGTGSVCTAMNAKGNTARAGGRGHIIDDAGSGYALGRDALSAVVQSLDKRTGHTALVKLIFDRLELSDIGGLISYVYDAPDKSRIAALAPLVEQAGQAGDSIALDILRRNGNELVSLVEAVCRQLEAYEIPLFLMGGLLTHDTLLKSTTVDALRERLPDVRIETPKTDAAGGAALAALAECRA